MIEIIGRALAPSAILAATRFAGEFKRLDADTGGYMKERTIRLYAGPDGAGIIEATNHVALASITGFVAEAGLDRVLEFKAADLASMAASAFASDPGETFEIRSDPAEPSVVTLETPNGSGGRVAVTGPTMPLAETVAASIYGAGGSLKLKHEPAYRYCLPGDYLRKLLAEIRSIIAPPGENHPRFSVLLFYRRPGGAAAALAVRDGFLVPRVDLTTGDIRGWPGSSEVALDLREIEPMIAYAVAHDAAFVVIDAYEDAPASIRVLDLGPETGTATFYLAPIASAHTYVANLFDPEAAQ